MAKEKKSKKEKSLFDAFFGGMDPLKEIDALVKEYTSIKKKRGK